MSRRRLERRNKITQLLFRRERVVVKTKVTVHRSGRTSASRPGSSAAGAEPSRRGRPPARGHFAPMPDVSLRAPRRPRRRAGRVLVGRAVADAVVVVVELGGRGAAHGPNAKKMEKFGAERRRPARAPRAAAGPYCDWLALRTTSSEGRRDVASLWCLAWAGATAVSPPLSELGLSDVTTSPAIEAPNKLAVAWPE